MSRWWYKLKCLPSNDIKSKLKANADELFIFQTITDDCSVITRIIYTFQSSLIIG